MADPIQGIIRSPNFANQPTTLQANERNELLSAQGLPPYAEMTRKGYGYQIMSVLAVAALVVRPSTVAAFEIWNGYPSGGKSLIIDRIFWHNLVSTNVVEGFSGWASVTAAKAAPAAGANVTARGNSGKAYPGPVIAGLGTTVIDSGWFPWGNGFTKGAGGVLPMGAIEARIEGRLVVPPQCALCLHVVASLVGDTFTQGAGWYEEQITCE